MSNVDMIAGDAGAGDVSVGDKVAGRRPAAPPVALGAAVALAGAAAIWAALRLPDGVAGGDPIGAAGWPVLLGALGIVAGAVLGVTGLRAAGRRVTESDVDPIAGGGVYRLLALAGSLIGYGVAWQWLDFRLVTVVWLAVAMAICGARGWKALALYPAVLTAALWALFGAALGVPL